MIRFNEPTVLGTEIGYIEDAINSKKLCGDGGYTIKCSQWMEENFGCKKVLLTPSCTDALDLAAMLVDIQPGDEVIMPSFTFTSSANAFVLRGAKIVFVDIRPDTMNIDEQKIEAAITDKTKAIVAVHYAGVACEMKKIMAIADTELRDKYKPEFYETLFKLMKDNLKRIEEDVSWFIDKYDYPNKDADWKNSKDAIPRAMQKLGSVYVQDPPFKEK